MAARGTGEGGEGLVGQAGKRQLGKGEQRGGTAGGRQVMVNLPPGEGGRMAVGPGGILSSTKISPDPPANNSCIPSWFEALKKLI